MTSDQEIHTLFTARRYGGNFISKLAEAGLAADPANRLIIFAGFPQLAEQFGPDSKFYSEALG